MTDAVSPHRGRGKSNVRKLELRRAAAQHPTHWKVGISRWSRLCQEAFSTDRRSSSLGLRLTKDAEAVLLAASQDMMAQLYRDADLLRHHAKRETLFAADLRCVRSLRQSWGDYALQESGWTPEDDEEELLEAIYSCFESCVSLKHRNKIKLPGDSGAPPVTGF